MQSPLSGTRGCYVAKSVNMMRSAWRASNREGLDRLANEWHRDSPKRMRRAELWFHETFGRPANACKRRRNLHQYASRYLRRHGSRR